MRLSITVALRTSLFLSAGLWLLTMVTPALVTPALADGGGGGAGDGGDSGYVTDCPRGEVWDAQSGTCVKQQSGILPDKELLDDAISLAMAERYDEALQVLNLLKNPNTAVALNYRGYVTRQLGHVDEGIAYYLKSIALDPRYAQVREYLGEAYVLKHEYPLARAQLQAIKSICGTECLAYKHLATAVAEGPSFCGSRYAGKRCS